MARNIATTMTVTENENGVFLDDVNIAEDMHSAKCILKVGKKIADKVNKAIGSKLEPEDYVIWGEVWFHSVLENTEYSKNAMMRGARFDRALKKYMTPEIFNAYAISDSISLAIEMLLCTNMTAGDRESHKMRRAHKEWAALRPTLTPKQRARKFSEYEMDLGLIMDPNVYV